MALKHIKINVKALECFIAIIETGSVTAAANRMGLTQPGVSRLLAILETQLGCELFQRRKGRVIATQEAIELLPEVEQALANLERIGSLAKNLHDFDQGRLNIAAPPSFIDGPLAKIVTKYINAYPQIRVSLEACRAETTKQMVQKRSADCGFVKLPLEHSDLSCVNLLKSRSVCVIHTDHPLASLAEIKVSMLKDEPLVLLGSGSRFRDQLESLFRSANTVMRTRLDVHTVGAACAFVKLGVGITIVNEVLALHYAHPKLAIIPLTPNINHEYGFIYSSHVPMSRATQAFLALCKSHFNV